MKIDKALGNLMLSTLGQSALNVSGISNKECVVISLWSGVELNTTERNAIRTSVDASGLIPGNWITNFTGRVELARLVLTNFNNRFIGNNLDVDLALSNRGEQFSFLNAGNASAFSIFVCNNSFASYAAGAGNTGRILLVGTVTDSTGNGDLKLNTVAISAQSRIRIPDVKMLFTYANYANTWNTGAGSAGPTEDPQWSDTIFLVKFDGSLSEEKSGLASSGTTGSISFVANTYSDTPGDQSLVLNGSTWADYTNISLAANSPATGDFTFEAFVSVDADQTTTGVIFSDYTNFYPQLLANIGNSVFRFRVSAGTTLESLSKFVAGQMMHVAVQRKGSDLELFLEGWRVGSITYTAAVNLTTLRFGVGQTAGDAFKGKIGSFRYIKAARYSGYGFMPPKNQFSRYPDAELVDFTNVKANFEFATSEKELNTDQALTLYSQVGAPNVVTYDAYGAVFNKTAGLMIPEASLPLGITNKFTIEAFVISFGNTPYSGNIIGFGTTLSNCVGIYINGFNMYYQDRNSGFASGGGTLVSGQEHHIAHVYDGTKHMFFIDGQLVASTTRALGTIASQQLYIGGVGTDNFNGKIRAARFSNDALYSGNFMPKGRLYVHA